MFSTKITWHDLDGNEVESTLSFHLYDSEIAELKLTEDIWDPNYIEDLKTRFEEEQKLLAEKKKDKPNKMILKELIHLVKEYVRESYGIKSENGRSFYKNKQATEDFMNSEAFSAFFLKIMGDQEFLMSFIEGVAAATSEQKAEIRRQVQDALKDNE